ncbi:hypothetical protein J2T13_005249 [Paenibacillus sp. DS2015]|uniref:hypothetical protein n=1 Tax=Paenibacillus sp. DS2015 TaxID=3373917 RepID=UPI003D203D11
MKMKETYIYKGYTITFEYNKNRKHLEYTAMCNLEGEIVKKHDDSFEGAKNQMEAYIENVPKYKLMYENGNE